MDKVDTKLNALHPSQVIQLGNKPLNLRMIPLQVHKLELRVNIPLLLSSRVHRNHLHRQLILHEPLDLTLALLFKVTTESRDAVQFV